MRLSVSIAPLALCLSFLAACGQAPIPVDSQATPKSTTTSTNRTSLPDGHPTGLTHPGLEGAEAGTATFSGTVRLTGSLASSRAGYLFVNVMPEGIRMPCYSRKFDLGIDDSAISADGDDLLVEFVLDERYELGGVVPGALVLEAVFDPDGYVDTKEPTRVFGTVAAKAGDTDLAVTLSPAQ